MMEVCFSFCIKCVHCEQPYSVQYDKWTIAQCTWEHAAEFQNELIAATNQNLHTVEVYRLEEKFTYRYTDSKIASHVEENYRSCKSVCTVHRKEDKGTIRPWNSNILQVKTM